MASQAGGMQMRKLTKLVSQWGCQKLQCGQTCSNGVLDCLKDSIANPNEGYANDSVAVDTNQVRVRHM